MKHPLTIIILASALAWSANIAGLVRHNDTRPVTDSETPAAEEMATATEPVEFPECNPGEHYDPVMDRCWPDDVDAPTPIPPDVQATLDSDPYDNDAQWLGWCSSVVNGREIVHPCDVIPGP